MVSIHGLRSQRQRGGDRERVLENGAEDRRRDEGGGQAAQNAAERDAQVVASEVRWVRPLLGQPSVTLHRQHREGSQVNQSDRQDRIPRLGQRQDEHD